MAVPLRSVPPPSHDLLSSLPPPSFLLGPFLPPSLLPSSGAPSEFYCFLSLSHLLTHSLRPSFLCWSLSPSFPPSFHPLSFTVHLRNIIPILKLGVRRSFQLHTANPWFNCFGLQTSSRVRSTQQSLKRVGNEGSTMPKRRTKASLCNVPCLSRLWG